MPRVPLRGVRRCDRCGAENADSLKFCKDCGNLLDAVRVAEATPPRGIPIPGTPNPGASNPVTARPLAPSYGEPGPSQSRGRLAVEPLPRWPTELSAALSVQQHQASRATGGGGADPFGGRSLDHDELPRALSVHPSEPGIPGTATAAYAPLPPVPAPPAALGGPSGYASPQGPAGGRPSSDAMARSRPAAPDFDFAPRDSNPRELGGRSHASGPMADEPSGPRCQNCGAENSSTGQFCTVCGAGLKGATPLGVPTWNKEKSARPSLPAPPTVGGHPPLSPTERSSHRPSSPLQGAPVVNLASATASSPPRVNCLRCGGSNSGGASFCQFCGARLESGERGAVTVPAPRHTSPGHLAQVPHAAAGQTSHGGSPHPGFEIRTPEPAPRFEPSLAATPAETPAVKRPGGPPPNGAVQGGGPASPGVGHSDLVLARVGQISPSAPPHPLSPAPAGVETGRYAPASDGARLTVIAQDGSPGRDYTLLSDQSDIGREEGTIQLPNDPYVCPRHARLYRRDGRFAIRDLGSVNGVYVRLRRPEPLRHGDLVLIGLEVLRFEVVTDAEKGLGPAMERGTKVFGSPAAPRRARLCQRTVEGVARDVFYITRDEVVIGRESGDLVFTGDPFMSRRHAAITYRPSEGTFGLRDLGSSNGTYMAIRGEVMLEPGDHVRIGQHLFRLDVDRKQ